MESIIHEHKHEPVHAHEPGHHHAHAHSAAGRTLLFALALTLGFSVVEMFAGWRSGSLALLADAGHMGTAALLNAVSMLVVVFMIASEAWQRLQNPGSVDGATVSIVAVVGLLINLLVAWVLSRGEHNLNVRAALLHVMGDALGSVAAIAAGTVIWLTGWTPIDPLLSILIGGLILASSVRLLREALHATLDGVPFAMDIEDVGLALARVSGVSEVHDLHVWPIAAERLAISAHVRVENLSDWPQVLKDLTAVAGKLGIGHVTFQPECRVAAQPIQLVRR